MQTADSSLLSASTFCLPSLCIERAKWMASQVTEEISRVIYREAELQSSPLFSRKIEEKCTEHDGPCSKRLKV